ncbi:hypothetical protein LOK49_LG08G02263 [Camellia lanceoleosa]|uniref:Uncharacterized protein n=1 Tax=Camellia lanceoleosa TaxID=1840588 RepID=A0ACC0GUJ9_9ERIC|nr:hypothetical protein LOK49_LG08G02263 [Camellia lanceoleosa]
MGLTGSTTKTTPKGLGALQPNSTAEDFDFMAAKQSGFIICDIYSGACTFEWTHFAQGKGEYSRGARWSIITYWKAGFRATGLHFHKYLSRGSSSEDLTSFLICTRNA